MVKNNEESTASSIEYSVSGGLSALLSRLGVSFAFTSYQSNILYMVGRNASAGINIHQSVMSNPMGLCLEEGGGLTLSAGYEIMRFQNVLDSDQRVNNTFDACYVPRVVNITGRLDAHDVGVNSDGQAVFINTRYNCIATTSNRHSFEELWRPPFISALVDEDRCHLNGLAMENGSPRYVTAVSASDTIDGWRDRRSDGGIVLDVQSNEVICRGLSMPHSPRLHNGELWLLNSGTGELGVVKRGSEEEGVFEPRAFCPGFLRGLAFHGNYAFVGLSKPRYKRFEGLQLDEKLQAADSEPWCGIQIIDLTTGSCVDWLRIDGELSELYDLEVIPGVSTPMAVPPNTPEAASLITLANS
ncbi:TIGR03032 family protein [Porticoccus sp. W117]|uniref:TIGR03032 family protein n=1 Tax=Porticoccus sp. W117 TaxID=3054777 RepID=UPI0025936642|nr:TIGR03032 family protein [Porticoccus sp. W117]MDM3870002.1 TIGR03032 family protein [Porticoccus sp. W117]